ncbi:MAG: AAA family ATPase, partial [Isosphaeraceae bacterium]
MRYHRAAGSLIRIVLFKELFDHTNLLENDTDQQSSLADVSLALEPVNVLFGPNGAGKSTLLDTIWFVRDCAI